MKKSRVRFTVTILLLGCVRIGQIIVTSIIQISGEILGSTEPHAVSRCQILRKTLLDTVGGRDIWVLPKIMGKPHIIPCLIGFSLIFTIHFWVFPLCFGNIHMVKVVPNLVDTPENRPFAPKKRPRLPTIHFQVQCSFQGWCIFISCGSFCTAKFLD